MRLAGIPGMKSTSEPRWPIKFTPSNKIFQPGISGRNIHFGISSITPNWEMSFNQILCLHTGLSIISGFRLWLE
jgi:hypothetical protein